MKETKSNRIEVPIKDKYLLTIKEAGADLIILEFNLVIWV
jgi:hypothetical protein